MKFVRQVATTVVLFGLLLVADGCGKSTSPQDRPSLLPVGAAPLSETDGSAIDRVVSGEPVADEKSTEFDVRWQRLAALRADVNQILRLQSADVEYMQDLLVTISRAQESLIECVEDSRTRPYSVGLRLQQLDDQRLGLLDQLQLARQRRERLSRAMEATSSLQRNADQKVSATRPRK